MLPSMSDSLCLMREILQKKGCCWAISSQPSQQQRGDCPYYKGDLGSATIHWPWFSQIANEKSILVIHWKEHCSDEIVYHTVSTPILHSLTLNSGYPFTVWQGISNSSHQIDSLQIRPQAPGTKILTFGIRKANSYWRLTSICKSQIFRKYRIISIWIFLFNWKGLWKSYKFQSNF